MAYEVNSIDEFLKHRASERYSSYLKNWKDNNPPEINVFLHTRRNPIVIWQHPFPRAFVRENKDTKKTERIVYGGNYNCRESEDVLKRQYHRKDDGTRKFPPVLCPMCRLVEHVRDLVEEEQMGWLTPIFRFDGDEDSRIVRAGGLFGMFKKDDLSEEEIKEARGVGIKFDEAWQENSYSKCNYIFCVVDVANVQDGVQVATVTNMLGDRVKEVINDRVKARGGEAGNPWLNPYCIQWEYLKHEREIQKKYKARPMDIPLTEPIKALILGDPPDLTSTVAPFNLQTMRAYLEQYCLVKLDWKYIFDVPLLEDDKTGKTTDPALPEEASSSSSSVSTAVAQSDACTECGKTEATGCLHVECTCGKPILETDATCKYCGKVWIAAPPPLPPPPAAPPTGRGRKRATVPGGKESGEKPPFA